MPTFEKRSIVTSLNQIVLIVLITMLQGLVGGCDFEIDTKVEIVTNSVPPVFSFKGNGNISRFAIYGPLVGTSENEKDPPTLWEIFPDREAANKSISEIAPIKYGELPKGWHQYPEGLTPPPLIEGSVYRVTANVNSANSGYIDIIVSNGRILLRK